MNDDVLDRPAEQIYERFAVPETEVSNRTQVDSKAVNDRTSQMYLWMERQASPKLLKRNQHQYNKSKLS